MTKIQLVVLYGSPADPIAFESHFSDVHRGLAAALPGLEAIESGRLVRALDRGEIPFHRLSVLTFADKDVMKSAFASEAGRLLGEDFAATSPAGTRQFILELDDPGELSD